jgi:hypothetical protein
VVGPTLRLLLQCMVTERDTRVQQALLRAWTSLLQHARAADVCEGLSGADMCCMLNLMATPCGSPLDPALLVVPLQGRLVAWGSSDAEEAGFCMRPAKQIKQEPGSNASSSRPGSAPGYGDAFGANGSGSFGSGLDPEAWVGVDDQEAAVRMRLFASKAIGQLCVKLQGQVRVWSCTGGGCTCGCACACVPACFVNVWEVLCRKGQCDADLRARGLLCLRHTCLSML